ncbi:MAG TPA: S26 family signal peptidase, partial [Actinomycetota bacterium]|nr:S26 family signal peptidase [Actinomycetota bacterium]
MDLSSSRGSTVETYHRGRERGRAAAVGALALATAVWLVVRWRPSRVEVRGDSMIPTLWPGDRALAVPARRPRRGHVVVVEHPARSGFEIVKRITGVPGDMAPDGRILGANEFWVEGDNPARSTDSRHHGAVHAAQVKARVELVYSPSSHRRLVSTGRPFRA